MMRIEDILATRSVGRMQSVGTMQVIPILGEDDDRFAPPEVEAGTSGYGEVHVRNRQGRDTIIPPGSAWIVREAVQDHALASGALVKAGSARKIGNAMCVQQSQPGLIPVAERTLQILPARLRVTALRKRHDSEYSRLWNSIGEFKRQFGLGGGGNLVDFLRGFATELDEFVAEFERVPGQLGAIVLIGGEIAGLELTPSEAYWAKVWVPLIRVCYGALALAAAGEQASVPRTRNPLQVEHASLSGIAEALAEAERADARTVSAVVLSLVDRSLKVDRRGAQSLDGAKMQTVTGSGLIGQVVTRGRGKDRVKYASLLASGA